MDIQTRRRAAAREGAVALAPTLLAYAPFALVVGTAVAKSAQPLAAWLGTSTIYGGAAHLAVLDVLAGGAGWLPAVAVGLLVNARLGAYAAAMAPQWRTAPLGQRVAAAVMLTDAPWALSRRRPDERRYYFGAAVTLFLAWPAMVTAGMLLGDRLAAASVTGLLPALALGAVVVTRLRARAVAIAAAASSVAALATAGLSAGVALPVCAGVGIVAATLGRRS